MQQPYSGFTPPPINAPVGGPTAEQFARSQVAGPAIALAVVSGLSLAFYLFALVVAVVAGGFGAVSSGRPEDIFGPVVGAAVYGFFALCSAFCLFGALRMRVLKSYGVAMAASIVAVIPCTTYVCCLLMLPFGVWSLVVLLKPEVKAAFS